ncbi:cytoplasmic protein [Thermodesulfobacteriota bacterium]
MSQNPDTQETEFVASDDNERLRAASRAEGHPGAEKAPGRHHSSRQAGVIYIKERYFTMLKKDLILRNPLRVMGYENNDILSTGQFGAVLARAGVGKTAFLVQLSLNALLRGKNVLHISLEDPVNKVSLWYKEVFNLIADQYQVDQIDQLWDSLLPHRFIMTFRVEGFSVPKLQERLADLMEQNIFTPQMIIVDGFPFNESMRQPLSEFKALVEKHQMHAWFTMRTHRHENPGPDGRPLQLEQVSDLFEVAIQLLPEGKEIHVKAVKGGESFAEDLDLKLDPSTMLLKRN